MCYANSTLFTSHQAIILTCSNIKMIRSEFFISCFMGFFFQILGRGDEKKSSENDQLTGHFQSFFSAFFPFFFFF